LEKAAIIGYGKLGSHLHQALKKPGRYSVPIVIKDSRSRMTVNEIKNCGIIFITVSDSNITEAAKRISGSQVDLKDKYVFHTSGALSSGLLFSLKKKGALTASFHPVQTFETIAEGPHKKFEKIYIAIEGDRKAVKKGFEIAKRVGSVPFVISPHDKVLHHINCVIASNYLVSYLDRLRGISKKITSSQKVKRILINGFKKHNFFDIYRPLIEQTLENIRTKGIRSSLTGPVQRNDINTIKLHLKTLREKLPEMLSFYSMMGIETAILAVKNRDLTKKEGEKMIGLFKKSIFRSANK
jgi:predicted short-subunit dehydrogenase-like oxidoreductase (DUF2520 family)